MRVKLSSPDKVLWPAAGLTKADLFAYMTDAADRLLPQIADRPLSLKRFPKGVEGKGFFQKDLPSHAPDTIGRWRVWAESADREVAYALVRDIDGLQWLAQQNTIELHPALMRVDRPDRADQLVMDIDPGPKDIAPGLVALWVKEVLDELGLTPRAKTSGGKGVHVIVPIERRYGMEELRPLTLAIARMVADRHPDDLTVEMRKADRGGRTLIDWSRGGGSTLIAAWSPRARAEATVAMPLPWEAVNADLDPTRWTVRNALDHDDPWTDDGVVPQRLEGAIGAVEDAGYALVDASPRDRTANALDRGGLAREA